MFRINSPGFRNFMIGLMKHFAPERVNVLKNLVRGMPVGLPETRLINVRCSEIVKPRINLLIPAIDKRHVYGGISTALNLFKELACGYDRDRIILTGTLIPSVKHLGAFCNYQPVSLKDDKDIPKQLVSLAEGYGYTLPVGPEDVFVATTWYTAYAIQRLIKWQSLEFNQSIKPMVYIIQDYEPGFYPWSSQYILAQSTYNYAGPMIPVFNSSLLKNYIKNKNHSFDYEYSFEPQMNRELRSLLENFMKNKIKKRKQLLVYGRPFVPRNAFNLIVETLRIWCQQYPQASTWQVISAGERHSNVKIGNGMVMKSIGKLSLENYARVLNESSVGFSLMISPHPSYPPLEMAHYGMWVLTNCFENKDLSDWHDNIISVNDCSPEMLSQKLTDLCEIVETDPMLGWQGKSHLPNYLSAAPLFPFVEKIHEHLNVTHNTGTTEIFRT